MSKKLKKIVSAVLAVTVISATVAYSMVNSNEKTALADTTETKKTIENTINENVKFTSTGNDKEETVYVLSDANGNVTKTIVSDWLKNKDGSDKIEDKSDLKNIENVKSDASFTVGANNTIVWDAKGEDIYYQGETDKKLPVDVKITYLLDGKEMSANEIAGKSGKVTIRFDYINNEVKEVVAGGVSQKMYVPFTMISGMILDGDKFSNVEINSGKVISDGDKFIVIGLAFPGMEENLNLSSILNKEAGAELSFPNKLEITADVEDFSLALTLTMGSADLISQINVGNMESLEDLKEVVNSLISATYELKSGTEQLNTGLFELKTSFEAYADGVMTLTSGVAKIYDGVGQLNDKVSAIPDGLLSVLNGIDSINENLSGENGAVAGAEKLADGVEELGTQLTAMVLSINNSIAENNTKMQGIQSILTMGLNPQTGTALTASETAYYQAALQQLQGANTALNSVLEGINPEEMSKNLVALSDGANTLSQGIQTLYGAINTQLRPGVNELYQGGLLLQSSVNQLYGGTETAVVGGNKLNSATTQVTEGIGLLYEGSVQLDNGMSQFKDEAIDKISDFIEGDFTEIAERIKATISLANDYTIYSMAGDGKNTSVKFIYETEGISSK